MPETLQPSDGTRELFLATAHVVSDAIADDAVGRAWNEPSALEHQLVGGLAGHLARGAVWVVDDYLDAALPRVPLVETAADYFALVAGAADDEAHRQIRERGADVGAQGQAQLCTALDARIAGLTDRLRSESPDRLVAVVGGQLRMPLDRYLETRIIEQVVHLDDLARSIDREPWATPPAALQLVLHVGLDIGIRRRGSTEMLRCLYRSNLEPALPVL